MIMKNDLYIKNGITIPETELEITASRSSGPGGQHVNKSSTRITVRWNVNKTEVLTEEQKQRVLMNLHSQLTTEGDLIVHSSAGRSQEQNKRKALEHLVKLIKKALYVPKKRIPTQISESKKEARLVKKSHKAKIKKLRSKKYFEE